MSTELTNLLPSDQERAFRAQYRFRLGTLALILLAAVIVVHGIVLVPSYLLLDDQLDAERSRLATLEATLSSSEGTSINTRLAALERDGARIVAIASSPAASSVIRAVLGVPHTGIMLSGFSYDAPAPSGRLVITGMAATRESLRQYVLALSGLPFVTNADLPLSAYAKEADIPFSIVLAGSLTP